MIISRSVMAGTEKQVLTDNNVMMEEKKQNNAQTFIEVVDSGPLRISGNFIIKDMKRGFETSAKEILLCRCGKSENKPYCDDSHKNK